MANEVFIPGGREPSALPPGNQPPPGPDVRHQVDGPAVGLIATAVLGLLCNGAFLIIHLLGISLVPAAANQPEFVINMITGTIGMISAVLGMGISGLVLYGAIRMRNARSYGLALASAIIALVPCSSPCCCLGLPIGIWALVVLLKPEVKDAFLEEARRG